MFPLLLLLALPAAAADLSIHEIVDRANKALRGDSSHGRLEMTIVTPSWTRTVEVEGWNYGRQFAHIIIHAPPKDKDNATLRRKNEMWLWMQRVERVIKIPPTMMHSSWQGSDFTYEDIVKADSIVKDYDHKVLETKEETLTAQEAADLGLKETRRTVYKLEGLPRPDAPVVWGKVIFWCAVYPGPDPDVVPIKEEDYSERGELIRTITLSKVKRVGGRVVPTRLECQPARKPGQKTILNYKELEFDIPLKESYFSLSRLQKSLSK